MKRLEWVIKQLKSKPNPKWLQHREDTDSWYIPIQDIYNELDRIFGHNGWDTEIQGVQAKENLITVVVAIRVSAIVDTNRVISWQKSGIASDTIKYNMGGNGSFYNKEQAITVPAIAYSVALKNACQKLGRRFRAEAVLDETGKPKSHKFVN